MAPGKGGGLFEEWLKKAKEDELSAEILLKEGGAPSTVCFLAQQMAEKYLKSLLVFHETSFPKVHDLLEMETLLLKVVPGIQEVHEEFNLLNRYYIETRYPGDFPEFSWGEAKKAYEAAATVRDLVLRKVKG